MSTFSTFMLAVAMWCADPHTATKFDCQKKLLACWNPNSMWDTIEKCVLEKTK
jgi:hypothetical protein